MQNLSKEIKDFLSLDEAAQQLGTGRKGLDTYLTNHSELKDKYLSKQQYKGRRKLVLDIEALPFIVITRNTNSKNLQLEGISKVKENLANKAIAEIKQPKKYNREALQRMVEQAQALLEQAEQIDDHETRIGEIEEELASDMAITTGQRQKLHERVNFLHFELEKKGLNVSQARIYGKMHEETGRATINDYKFEDYRVAIRVLKDWYKRININWN